MTEEPSKAWREHVQEMLTQAEKRMMAVQDQVANQWETQRKAVEDMLGKMFRPKPE